MKRTAPYTTHKSSKHGTFGGTALSILAVLGGEGSDARPSKGADACSNACAD